jgi:hypothetical protein
LTIPRHPGHLNRLVLVVAASTHVSTAVFSACLKLAEGTWRFVPAASHFAVTSDARAGRVRLAEQPVVSLFQGTTATRAASCRTKPGLGPADLLFIGYLKLVAECLNLMFWHFIGNVDRISIKGIVPFKQYLSASVNVKMYSDFRSSAVFS